MTYLQTIVVVTAILSGVSGFVVGVLASTYLRRRRLSSDGF